MCAYAACVLERPYAAKKEEMESAAANLSHQSNYCMRLQVLPTAESERAVSKENQTSPYTHLTWGGSK